MNEPLELVVIEGQKSGARVTLQNVGMTSVGIDYDCDVVLGLPALNGAPRLEHTGQENASDDVPKLQLQRHDDNVLLKVLSGRAQIGEEHVQAGAQLKLLPNTSVRLNDSVFVVGPASSFHHLVPSAVSKQQESLPETVAQLPEQRESAPVAGGRTSGWMHAVAGLCVLVGSVVFFSNVNQSNAMTMHDVSSLVRAELEHGGFNQLVVTSTAAETVVVSGFLDNRSQLHDVRDLLSPVDTVIEWDIQLGESLAESVRSVYQVNGVSAIVTSSAKGAVVVETKVSDVSLLARIEETVRTDVADLEQLDRVNQAPVVVAAKQTDKNGFNGVPGKRIMMIVSGEYILTEDGAVYYAGSVLPSGHKVLAILDKKIQVQLNETQMELTF